RSLGFPVKQPSVQRMVDADVLRLLVGSERLEPLFAPVARELIASEGELDVQSDAERVDPDLADTQLRTNSQGLVDVAGMDTSHETEGRVVGEIDGLVRVIERNHGQDRPKDLFARY